jgi:hypothetical protein
LGSSFKELRGVSVDNLMYIKVGVNHNPVTVQKVIHLSKAFSGPCFKGYAYLSHLLGMRPSVTNDRVMKNLDQSPPSPPQPVQEDIILPQHYTFYELIKTKARGKSGPLFDFGVTEDIRLVNDATKEKTDSHAGKVVERHWYDRNKHIFPANRWEVRREWRLTIHPLHGGMRGHGINIFHRSLQSRLVCPDPAVMRLLDLTLMRSVVPSSPCRTTTLRRSTTRTPHMTTSPSTS